MYTAKFHALNRRRRIHKGIEALLYRTVASQKVTHMSGAARHLAVAVVAVPRQGANIDLILLCMPPPLLPPLAAPGDSR
jgi:hypothetical protein